MAGTPVGMISSKSSDLLRMMSSDQIEKRIDDKVEVRKIDVSSSNVFIMCEWAITHVIDKGK